MEYLIVALYGSFAAFWGRWIYRKAKQRGKRKRTRRAFASAQVRAIAGVGDGMVHVRGQVRAPALLVAPVSRRPCVAYELEVEAQSGKYWVEAFRQSDSCRFEVIDASGGAYVVPEHDFEVALTHTASWTHPSADDERERLLQLLEAAGVAIVTSWFSERREFRYREALLVAGESASIRGHAVRQIDPQGTREGLRGPPTIITLQGTPEVPLLISDLPEIVV